MSSPLRSPVTAALMLGGAIVAFFGIAMSALGRGHIYVVVAVAGIAVEFGGAWHHDWMHMRRGEQPHAFWGRDDHNRPEWLGGPRRPSE